VKDELEHSDHHLIVLVCPYLPERTEGHKKNLTLAGAAVDFKTGSFPNISTGTLTCKAGWDKSGHLHDRRLSLIVIRQPELTTNVFRPVCSTDSSNSCSKMAVSICVNLTILGVTKVNI
jgi:hypothetical protein